jgi:hypothetical protein
MQHREERVRACGGALRRETLDAERLHRLVHRVDALVRYEWAAYYHSITDRTPALLLGEADFKWVVRTFYAIFYSVCFGLSLWGVQNLYAVQSPWATPAAWLFALVSTWEVITIIRGGRRRRRARAKDTELQTRLLMAMDDTYDSLDGTALSPTRVRDAMQSAKDKGVVYSQVVWPIIDAAVARDPHVWKVSPPDEVF